MQDRSDQQLRTAQERTSGIFSAVCKGDTVLLGALRDAGDILKPDELGINLTVSARMCHTALVSHCTAAVRDQVRSS
jgi:hypothetical protein